jgi:hypothetical protein
LLDDLVHNPGTGWNLSPTVPFETRCEMDKFIGFACVLLLSTPCLAQVPTGLPPTPTTTTTTITTNSVPGLRASQILGSAVHLQGTNHYGKVEDLILGDGGGPTYLVVSNAGRYAMMPFGAATFDQGQRAFTYNVTPQAVQPLLFNQNAYPNLADPQFTNRTNQVFATSADRVKIKEKPNGTIKEKIKPF